MRLRKALGRRGLVAPLAALLFSCTGGPAPMPPVELGHARTAEELRGLLDSICSRSDIEALIARARVYARLRELEGPVSPTLLAQGDAADLDVMSHGASDSVREESAGRLSRHFRERAENPVLSRSSFPGPLGEPLRRLVLLTIAAYYGESASRSELTASLDRLSTATGEFAAQPSLSPDSVKLFRKLAQAERERAAVLSGAQVPLEASPEALKFSDADQARHLEEGTRAADLGTREKADRADFEGVVHWYILALAHYGVVRETVTDLSSPQEHVLGAQDIVVRSLCDLLSREP
ncbi:MAG TPA: hypothetical protein VMU54_24900 [Planctomycetota bacterium]|nr:hypothetical protein [Planctomycetota bacterium]